MPEASSMIRTVPGGNVGPAGGGGWAIVGSAAGVPPLPDRPTRRPAPTTRTRTSSEIATTQPARSPPLGAGSGWTGKGAGRGGGASRGDARTETPGPAGVATSDQLRPFHHRTRPGAPSGSGYQPGGGAGCPGPVTATP